MSYSHELYASPAYNRHTALLATITQSSTLSVIAPSIGYASAQ